MPDPITKQPLLKPGSVLGVCGPSARFDHDAFRQGIQVLEDMGFRVKVPNDIFNKKRYLAGEDRGRAMVINNFFSDPDIDGIVCARGGFGAMRILDHINWDVIRRHPKPFVGFSDITAILLSMMSKTRTPVIHGPTVVSLATAARETLDSFYNTLTGVIHPIVGITSRVICPGQSTGRLTGGNISTISHLLGTRFQPDFNGSVLFLEDIGEPAYKIDRMLFQMKMAGLFNKLRGVILGSFENCKNPEYLDEIFQEAFEDNGIPVLWGLAAGHGPVNLSLSMGTAIEMDTQTLRIRWI